MDAAHASRQTPRPLGEHLRRWRQQRRLSQLQLSEEAEISTRHLSCLETGRAMPSRDMVLRLAERLQVPLRERNALLVAAGYAPMYRERRLDDPALAAARQAVELILKSHEPWPALALDRHWNIVAANRGVAPLLQGASAALLTPPVNVARLSLHPEGVAPRIVNLGQWREHLLARLQQQIQATADPVLQSLREELLAYPQPPSPTGELEGALAGVVVPLQFAVEDRTLSFISTTTVFGSPVDITLQELALETFLPADEATAEFLRGRP
ncbi:helix-turn-helix transcriptional regulator [Ramlibacter rhizophilus]|uniref:XRE family transcriptional regulator n=1 Tax=Ramlibacter rhizophilus TaxID=1781167 RepID=A0A4Z0BCM0_9BURK|nr:helix-turn-helix transcriptional regulator [Ramlibacter rhizophilus]TFY96962.1 XRE family transcriptional regulator [Ramlibacter rhizophilus]